MTRKLHFTTGMILLVFIASHFSVHLFALAGPEAHIAALEAVQGLYRNPVIEPLLVAAILVQVVLGIRLVIRRWSQTDKGFWGKAQLTSGLYLAFFMLNHTTAALYTRYVGGLETNFWWVAGPLQHPLMVWFFYPYYTLAVLAVAAHVGAALHYRWGKLRAAKIALGAGIFVAAAYLLSFGGWLYPVAAKPEYRAYYDAILASMGIS